MKLQILLSTAVALVLGAIQAPGQSVIYTFSGGTADGWANAGFSSSPVASVANIGGQNYIFLPLGGFQVGNVASDSPGNLGGFNAAMTAAAANPAGYNISYDYYIDTAAFTGANFLQIGTFVNSGSGYYAQNYGASQLELNGTQLASGQVFQGTITVSLAAAGYVIPPADTYFRLGIIQNGDGTGVGTYFRNISVAPVVPEPTSLTLCGMGLIGGWLALRRRNR